MSESVHHRCLVEALANEISDDSIWARPPILYTDVREEIGAGLPPIIGGSRPDVYARDIGNALSIIGEAKTSDDIDNQHTFVQLVSYFDYLSHQPRGELWVGVPWLSAGTATRVCRDVRKRVNALHIPICIVGFMIGNVTLRRTWRE